MYPIDFIEVSLGPLHIFMFNRSCITYLSYRKFAIQGIQIIRKLPYITCKSFGPAGPQRAARKGEWPEGRFQRAANVHGLGPKTSEGHNPLTFDCHDCSTSARRKRTENTQRCDKARFRCGRRKTDTGGPPGEIGLTGQFADAVGE